MNAISKAWAQIYIQIFNIIHVFILFAISWLDCTRKSRSVYTLVYTLRDLLQKLPQRTPTSSHRDPGNSQQLVRKLPRVNQLDKKPGVYTYTPHVGAKSYRATITKEWKYHHCHHVRRRLKPHCCHVHDQHYNYHHEHLCHHHSNHQIHHQKHYGYKLKGTNNRNMTIRIYMMVFCEQTHQQHYKIRDYKTTDTKRYRPNTKYDKTWTNAKR